MAIVMPCIRGKIGNTEYYQAKMAARELVTGIRPAKELDEWASMGIEERMQREPNLKRIRDEIAPYIAKTKDRFFGSVIVLVYKGEVHFEELKDVISKLPRAYMSVTNDIGFLTINGGSLIMLDGQHRLLALEKVVKNEIPGKYADDVPNDEISVIFINHESNEKTRRIFNKVNRYAKTTSRGDNLITSEDDGYAILTRWLLNDGAPLGVKNEKNELALVNWKQNTLTTRSTNLTTISVVYETIRYILNGEGKHLNESIRPSDQELEECYELVESFWKKVLAGVKPYTEALIDLSEIPIMREPDEPYSLLFKPAGQIAFFKGLVSAVERGLDLDTALERANQIEWSMNAPIWKDIIIRTSGAIDASADARERTSLLIAYLLSADTMGNDEITKVEEMCKKAQGEKFTDLPSPVVS